MKCPVCESIKSRKVINLHCGNFDNSNLYEKVRIRQCKDCGHVYNELTDEEKSNLIKYYDNEYAKINLSNKKDNLDMYSQEHYQKIYDMLELDTKNKEIKILDVGGNTGGFLRFLKAKGFKNIYGVDWSIEYLNIAKKEFEFFCKLGSCEHLPYKDDVFDIIVADQVLEHTFNVKQAIEEFNRVLKKDGQIYVSVPDIQEYMNTNFFPFYWFIMREHVQHYSIRVLENLMIKNNYYLYNISKDKLQLGEYELRTLDMLFSKIENNSEMIMPLIYYMNGVKNSIDCYISDSKKKLKELKKELKLLRNKFVVFVGIGREFLFLYKNIISKWNKYQKCDSKIMIDSIEYKQDNLTIDNQYIYNQDKELNKKYNENEFNFYITAFTHRNKIQEKLNNQ